MAVRKRFRDFRDWCPQPPSRFPTNLKHYSAPIAITLVVTICSVSIFAASSSYLFGVSTLKPLPILPLSSSSSVPGFSLVISQNTTWTAANSPYNLPGNVFVSEGVTLTIEAGVTVNFYQCVMQVNGTLNVQGTPSHLVNFATTNAQITDAIHQQAASINFGDSSIDDQINGAIFGDALGLCFLNCNSSITLNNDQFPNQGVPLSGGFIRVEITVRGPGTAIITNDYFTGRLQDECAQSTIANSTFMHGGIDSQSGSFLILNNTFIGAGDVDSGFGLNIGYNEKAVVSDNHFSGYSEACIDIAGSSFAWIQRNLIENPQTAGGGYPFFGIEVEDASPVIENNTITNCNIGMEVYNYNSYMWAGTAVQANPTIRNNNICSNQEYNLFLGYPQRSGYNPGDFFVGNINATDNWWGTADTQAINQTIWDNKDQSNVGTATFTPFLTALNQQATPNPAVPTPTIAQIPTTTFMEASGGGQIVHFIVNGNLTLGLNSLANVTTTQKPPATNITFNQEGGGVSSGFLNVTIPKNEVPYGKTPTLYADNQRVHEQGYVQDAYNYYVWGTVNNTAYGSLTISFTSPSANVAILPIIIGAMISVVIVVIAVLVIRWKKRVGVSSKN